jgi:predicted DNA-binding transcriptional regulator AlpA
MSRRRRETVVLMDYAAIAERTGLEVQMLRLYKARGKMPAPDYMVSQSPGWLPETIEEWVKSFTPEGLPPARKRVG